MLWKDALDNVGETIRGERKDKRREWGRMGKEEEEEGMVGDG